MVFLFTASAIFIISCLTLFILASRNQRQVIKNTMNLFYIDQIQEVEKDLRQGLLSENEAISASLEIKKRLSLFDDENTPELELPKKKGVSLTLICSLTIIIFLSTTLIYSFIGSPYQEDLPYQKRKLTHINTSKSNQIDLPAQELGRLAKELLKKLKLSPKNVNGWLLLGRTYMTLGQWKDAANSFSEAYRISPLAPDIATSYSEALYMADGEKFTSKTKTILKITLKRYPRNPKSLFYFGLAMALDGNHKSALQAWVNLISISQTSSPWMPTLHQHIQESIQASGLKLEQFKPNFIEKSKD